MRYLLFFLISITAFNCASQKQGIVGKVVWVAGDQMPGPDKKNTPSQGIEREVHFYEPATLSQAKRTDGFFIEIQTPLVAKVKSKADGSFEVSLPAGEYSVLTKEPEGLFANIFDGQGRINVIRVKKGKFEAITLIVNYQAAY